MIVILKRVTAAAGRVTSTEWLLIFFEGLLVFVSIFAAFQLDQWADRQRAEKEQAALLDRLVDEAEASVAILRAQRDGYEGWKQDARVATDAMVNRGECPTTMGIAFARNLPPLAVPTAVYDEMSGTGGLSILPGSRVRQVVARYHASREAYDRQIEYARLRVPSAMDSFIRMGFRYTFDPDVNNASAYGGEKVSPGDCTDPVMRAEMGSSMFHAEVVHDLRHQVTDDAIAMCAVLAQRAGRRCTPTDTPLEGRDAQLARGALEEER